IHNLMNTEKVEKGMEMTNDLADIDPTKINIISVIRFHPQKAADRLLLAHQYVINQGIDHELYLIGGGEQEEMLLKMQKELKLTHVHFLGFKTNPYADIRACDLFVLPSLYEGFATVINESFIAGTPVLSTEVAGVHEQITAPHYGWIVENSQEGLNQGLLKALSSKAELQKMKQQLQGYHYPNDEIIRKFTEVL
ncbi:MAG: glycosyltransferase, partial [Holdemania massiliensis]